MSVRPLLLLLVLGAACPRNDPPVADASTGDASTSTGDTGDSTSGSSSTGDDTTGPSSSTTADDTTGTTAAPFCGDGQRDPGELCDDGPDNSDLGACKLDCTPQACGDGLVGPGELCDDGNQDDNDTCTAACIPAACGDGLLGPGEACDDGNLEDNDACTNACKFATCGDGLVQPPEDCDAAGETADCDADCTLPMCNDGVHNPTAGEPCDDGNPSNYDYCLTDCTLPACGDGYKQPGEACDDGNLADNDGCSPTCVKQQIKCQNGGALKSIASSSRIALCHHALFCEQDYDILCPFGWHLCSADEFNFRNDGWDYSPDRLILGGIRCREGGGAGQFGFKHNMSTDHADNCLYSSSRIECVGDYGCDDKDAYALCCAPLPFCGDGDLDPEEQCDDGNDDNGDDCFSNCMTRIAPDAQAC